MLAKDASKRRQCLGHVAACSMTILSDIAFFDYFLMTRGVGLQVMRAGHHGEQVQAIAREPS